jgi:excisionase family DNA binding protein
MARIDTSPGSSTGSRGVAATPDRLLTARDLADRLGVSVETVLRWTRRGDVPAIRLPGGAIRYREDEIECWLEERATTSRGGVTAPRLAAARSIPYGASPHPSHEEE